MPEEMNVLQITVQVISLIGALATVILGVVAIWLSLYFYRRGNELSNSLTSIISRIEASTRVTETASRDVLQPVMSTVIAALNESLRSKVDNVSRRITQRSATSIQRLLSATTENDRQSARAEFIAEIDSLVGLLRNEVVIPTLSLESGRETRSLAEATEIAPPGSPNYDWAPFIRRIRDLEAANRFLSAKWLREKKFAGETQTQMALQIAIDRAMLLTYHIDNPRNPQFPTLCCRLNREHEVVNAILLAIGEKAPHAN